MKRLGLADLAATDEVARWMCEAFSALGTLRRADAAKGIERRFGRAFVHRNANGNQVIDSTVLRAFRGRVATRCGIDAPSPGVIGLYAPKSVAASRRRSANPHHLRSDRTATPARSARRTR